ncbi:element excision factor XisH family protein [Roseofilum casamattae]|uniref:Element excision factor XisH family protein n=1 Tax=Roseofilum casamattae BLCC-M143 TaxID=3022442 RepID=A0ABT7BVG4_9CYAN|nr:element excision factor XisH family protein [Roseofilum casamattae]MDJ1182451.1 element excision factor XisH family protein [Roseofilum casamattae BLCC-M143]
MAKDKYHQLVKTALVNEGWQVTDDPLIVSAGSRKVQVDLGAERLITAERDREKIAVEVKSFVGLSALHDLYTALGQFNVYQYALEKEMPERELFLAVPSDTYNDFLKEEFMQELLDRHRVKLIIYHIERGTIDQWIR